MLFGNKKKFMVIGIDGVPYEQVMNFAREGIMPHTKNLIEKYGLIKTKAPLPEVSSVSWTSFMTGMNPGEHGIYGFMEMDRDNYSYTFPSFKNLRVRTVWEEIGERKKSSIIINLPNTYPARPMKGILVSGFVALDLARAAYPPSILSTLEKMNYQVDVDTALGKTNKKLFLKELTDILGIRYDYFKKVTKKEKWDLGFFIITGTDRLHHFLFDALEDPASEYHRDFLEYYRYVDQIVAEIITATEKQGIPFIILSDHGFVRIKTEVYISQYLKKWGYLELDDENPQNLKSMNPKTRVFALDPSRLYIHLEGKYKRGPVKKEDYQQIREEIKAKFLELEIEGEKVMREVFYKEDVYYGQFLDQAPDLVLVSKYGYDLKSGITKNSLYGKTFFEGMHSWDNAMLIDSYGFTLGEHPYIYNIGKRLKEFFF